jgi:uncharacterized protein YpmS
MKSLGKIGFPGIVKTFKLIAINHFVAVGIAVRVIKTKNSENLVSTYSANLSKTSFTVVILVEVSLEFLGKGLVSE